MSARCQCGRRRDHPGQCWTGRIPDQPTDAFNAPHQLL